MSNFYPSAYDPAKMPEFNSDGSLNPNGPGFSTVPGVPLSNVPFYLNGVIIAGQDGTPRGMVQNYYNTFAPRIGFAYDVTGDSKTIVRGGFGMFYERIQGNDVYNTGPNPPFSFNPSVNSVYFSIPSVSAINGQAASVPIFPAGITALAYSDYKIPTSMQWNFGIQRQLGQRAVFSVAYVGNSAYHQRDNRELNAVSLDNPNRAAIIKGTYNTNLARPYPGYQPASPMAKPLLVQITTPSGEFPHGRDARPDAAGSYTWSHSIDYRSGDFFTMSNPFDRAFDHGDSDLDRRHIFSA